MNKLKQIIKMCIYEFRIQLTSKKTWLGYIIGVVIVLKQCFGYVLYARSLGRAVNILEPFIIAENNYNTVMFMVLGWLLVISDAPFINNNSMYLIYRTEKNLWNKAMHLYMFVQSVLYYGVLVISTMILSADIGYFGNIWSQPLISLTKNSNRILEFDVYFPYASLIKNMSIYQAFAYTVLLCLGYGFILALLLYTLNLFMNHLVGGIVTLSFHFLGYEIMQEGFFIVIKYSMLARSLLVLQEGVNLGASLEKTIILYVLIIIILCSISDKAIKFIDFKEAGKGEGE